MTEQADRIAVVVSANHGLVASLAFHCTLPLDFNADRAATAAVVLVDVPGGSEAGEVLRTLEHVAPQKIVLLCDRQVSLGVGRVLVRPLSVSDIGAALEAVADAASGGLSEPGSRTPSTATPERDTSAEGRQLPSGSDASAPSEAPVVGLGSAVGTAGDVEDVPPPDRSPEDQAFVDGLPPRPQDGDLLLGDVTEPSSADDRTRAAPAPDEEGPLTPDTPGGLSAPPSAEQDFRWQLKRGTTAARDLAGVLRGFPALADPRGVMAEVAAEAAEGAKLDMLGLWRNDAGVFMPLGGYGLRPSDARRPITMEHPIVQGAWQSGGLVVTRVADDPAVVAGLPGVYQAAMLLLPFGTAEGHEVLAIGAGDDVDESQLQVVEDILSASASVIDFGIALDALLAALEL